MRGIVKGSKILYRCPDGAKLRKVAEVNEVGFRFKGDDHFRLFQSSGAGAVVNNLMKVYPPKGRFVFKAIKFFGKWGFKASVLMLIVGAGFVMAQFKMLPGIASWIGSFISE